MGLGKFLGDLGKSYLSDRGIGGAIEDANSIKNGLQQLFGSNDSEQKDNYESQDGYEPTAEDQEAYSQDWNNTIEKLQRFLVDRNYTKARGRLDSFYTRHGEQHDWYYQYWSTQIALCEWLNTAEELLMDNEDIIEVDDNCNQKRNKIKGMMTTLKRTLENDDQMEMLHKLQQYLSDGDNEIEELIAEHKQKQQASSDAEKEYIEEIKACLADDGTISDRERRLLNRLRDSLGISEERAQELEAFANGALTDDEKDYLDALKDSLQDGQISDRERRLLDKLRASLNISEERAAELEKRLK